MASTKSFAALLLVALASPNVATEAGVVASFLHPHRQPVHALHQHKQVVHHAAYEPDGALTAATAAFLKHPIAAAAAPAEAEAPRAAVALEATDDDGDGVVSMQLLQELAEVKQSRANIEQLKAALSAEVALLRESTKMQKVARSRAARHAASEQVKHAERLVKETGAMLQASRAAAAADARSAMGRSAAVRRAADSLSAEANSQLSTLESPSAPAKKARPFSDSEEATQVPVVAKEEEEEVTPAAAMAAAPKAEEKAEAAPIKAAAVRMASKQGKDDDTIVDDDDDDAEDIS